MAADLAWNLESIPERAREQALRSARQEGIPVGEWMTRQIFEGLADSDQQAENSLPFEHRQGWRGADLDRAESPIRNSDAVRRLQQDLGRLGREISDTVRRSDAHFSALADGLEELSRDLSRLRAEASSAGSSLEERLEQTAGQLTVQLSSLVGKLESLAAESRNEQARASGAAKAVENRLTHAEQTVQALATHRDDTARTVAAALEAMARQFEGAKDLTSRLEQRLGVVEHGLDWLGTVRKNDIHELSTRISAIDGRFDDVRQDAQGQADLLNERLASMQAEINRIDGHQQQESLSRSEALEEIGVRLEQLRSTVDDGDRAVGVRLDEMMRSFTELSSRQERTAADTEVKFSHLDADLALKLESTVRLLTLQQQTAVSALASRHGELENALAAGIAELKDRQTQDVRSVADQIADLVTRLAELQRATSDADRDADRRIETLRQLATEQQARHQELADQIKDLNDRIASSDAHLAEANVNHAELAAEFRSKIQDLAQESAIAKAGRAERMRALFESINDLKNQGAEAHRSITDISARIDEMQRSVTSTAESVDQRIENLQQVANELEHRNAGRYQALEHGVQTLADRLASSEERFVEKTRHGELAADVSARLEALDRQIKAADSNIADVNRAHAESARSAADQIGTLIFRLDELHHSTSDASESVDKRIEDLRQLAQELDRRNTDRHQALGCDIRDLTERLASSEERFVDKTRHGEFTAELAGKLEALEQLARTVDGNLAEIHRVHSETERTVADRIADFTGRIDDLQTLGSQSATSVQQRFGNLEQRANELFDKLEQLQKLGASSRDMQDSTKRDIEELRRDIDARLALLEPPLAHLQHVVEQSDLRHETQERLLGEKLEELADKLTQVRSGFERRLAVVQNDFGGWHDSHATLTPPQQQTPETLVPSPASTLPDFAPAPVNEAALSDEPTEHPLPPPLPREFAPDIADGEVEWGAELDSGLPAESAPATTVQSEAAADTVAPDIHADKADLLDTAAYEVAALEPDDLAHPSSDSAAFEDDLSEPPPFPELPAPGAIDVKADDVHEHETGDVLAHGADAEPAPQPEPQSTEDLLAEIQPGAKTAEPVTPSPSFISQARQAAQMAAKDSELSVGKVVQKTRLSVVAAVTVVVLSVAGARLWLARTSAPAPRATATESSHAITEVRHVMPAPSRSAVSVATKAAAGSDPLLERASSGDGKAQLILGVRAFESAPNAQSDKDAFTWLSRAAAQRNPVAECYLAMLYQKGRGVAADPRQAFNLYSASASAGNRLAMNNLAVAYAQGNGVNKDVRQAALWFSEAADRGLIEAQFDLAVLYERGMGVPQSLSDAYRWYTIAARAGDGESKARAEAIATELSPAERDAANQDAAQYKPLTMATQANDVPRD